MVECKLCLTAAFNRAIIQPSTPTRTATAARHDPEEAAKFFRALLEDMSDAEIVLMYEILRRHFPQK